MAKAEVKHVIIDEAHCISTWGDSFRPAFKKLVSLRCFLPSDVTFLCLTATASTSTITDIKTCLQITQCAVVSLSPNRYKRELPI